MDKGMTVGLREEIIAEITAKYHKEPWFNAEVLRIDVNDAYRKVKSRKCYENTSYTDEQIEKDLYNRHFQDIKDIAIYRGISTSGAENEISHNENGVSRTWRTEDEILGNITAFVKVF